MKNQKLLKKIRNALAGLGFAWHEEDNFRRHVWSGGGALALFLFIQPQPIWWALIILCIALVVAAELINSAIEALADRLHPDIHPAIGKVKDMLAGMVLVISMAALLVALLACYDSWFVQ